MKLLACVLAVCVGISLAQERADQKEQAKNYCNACFANLNSCLRYPFETAAIKAKVKAWADCLSNDIDAWRSATGLRYWPDAAHLSSGRVGGGIGRLQCINWMMHKDSNAGCNYCAAFTPEASKKFEARSQACGGE